MFLSRRTVFRFFVEVCVEAGRPELLCRKNNWGPSHERTTGGRVTEVVRRKNNWGTSHDHLKTYNRGVVETTMWPPRPRSCFRPITCSCSYVGSDSDIYVLRVEEAGFFTSRRRVWRGDVAMSNGAVVRTRSTGRESKSERAVVPVENESGLKELLVRRSQTNSHSSELLIRRSQTNSHCNDSCNDEIREVRCAELRNYEMNRTMEDNR